jgi:molecular chaperone GrpE
MESLKTAAGDRADRDKAVRLEEGIRLIHHMMRRALADHGVEEIVAVGRQFDPEMHEAMAQEETADHPTGEVLEVLEKGYRHRDVVVRPSKVKVAVNVRDAQEGVRGGRAGEREAE